jgi:hypothetical protein
LSFFNDIGCHSFTRTSYQIDALPTDIKTNCIRGEGKI